MATFPQFVRFPVEIQEAVWEAACSNRLPHVLAGYLRGPYDETQIIYAQSLRDRARAKAVDDSMPRASVNMDSAIASAVSLPLPGLMRACRLSRTVGFRHGCIYSQHRTYTSKIGDSTTWARTVWFDPAIDIYLVPSPIGPPNARRFDATLPPARTSLIQNILIEINKFWLEEYEHDRDGVMSDHYLQRSRDTFVYNLRSMYKFYPAVTSIYVYASDAFDSRRYRCPGDCRPTTPEMKEQLGKSDRELPICNCAVSSLFWARLSQRLVNGLEVAPWLEELRRNLLEDGSITWPPRIHDRIFLGDWGDLEFFPRNT